MNNLNKPKKILLVVEAAKDVFIYNMAKWLKASMPSVVIDVFEFCPNDQQQYDYRYYDYVASVQKNWCTNVKYVRNFLSAFHEAKELDRFLEDKHYDIIQCHWIRPAVVLSKEIRNHCDRLFATFWGGELEVLTIMCSKKLYKQMLHRFSQKIDCLMNSKVSCNKLSAKFPVLSIKCHEARLGATSLDYLYGIMESETQEMHKNKWGFSLNKYSVLIGYSGKSLHQHLKVVKYFVQNTHLADKVHLVAVMTRGCSAAYTHQLEEVLKQSGYSYTVIKDRFLSDEEIASLRYATDITLQLSAFDGFSRSIVESLIAQSVVIYGLWLNYGSRLKDEGFKAFSAHTFEDAFKLLTCVVDDYDYFKAQVADNPQAGKTNTWVECIKDWVEVYSMN